MGVGPSENLEHPANFGTTGLATDCTSRRVVLSVSPKALLYSHHSPTPRGHVLELFPILDLSGFAYIPHSSRVSFCDPGAPRAYISPRFTGQGQVGDQWTERNNMAQIHRPDPLVN